MLLLGHSQRIAATSFLARLCGSATARLPSAADPGGANSARTVTLISATSAPLPICTAQFSAAANRGNAATQKPAINHGDRRIVFAPPPARSYAGSGPNKHTIFHLDRAGSLLLRDRAMPSARGMAELARSAGG